MEASHWCGIEVGEKRTSIGLLKLQEYIHQLNPNVAGAIINIHAKAIKFVEIKQNYYSLE
jgi:hypothetical protein